MATQENENKTLPEIIDVLLPDGSVKHMTVVEHAEYVRAFLSSAAVQNAIKVQKIDIDPALAAKRIARQQKRDSELAEAATLLGIEKLPESITGVSLQVVKGSEQKFVFVNFKWPGSETTSKIQRSVSSKLKDEKLQTVINESKAILLKAVLNLLDDGAELQESSEEASAEDGEE